MRAKVLVDNIKKDNMPGEWGLSIYIEYEDHNILLDVGASGLFLENAKAMNVNIEDVECAVLSHSHYDHSDGMDAFFKNNSKAKFYLRNTCKENCFTKKWIFHKYIGIPKGILNKYSERINLVSGDYKLMDGVFLIPHKTEGLAEIGIRESMYRKEQHKWVPDDFNHEQSLVFKTDKGMVVFNSCSHGGADNIINEIQQTFPDHKVYALIGGFHLFNKSEKYIRQFSNRVKDTGIEYIYTGHCTGNRAFNIMKEELGDKVHKLNVGLEMQF